MGSNSNPYDKRTTFHSLGDEMAYFDALPPELREVVREVAPKLSCKDIVYLLAKYSSEILRAAILEQTEMPYAELMEIQAAEAAEKRNTRIY